MEEFSRRSKVWAAIGAKGHGDFGFQTTGPGSHHKNAVAEKNRFIDIVRDEQCRRTLFAANVQEKLLHDGTGLGIQRPKRLIHQQNPRRVGEGTGNRNPLTHPAGKLLGKVIPKSMQADRIQEVIGQLLPFGLFRTALLRAKLYVLAHGQPRKQRVSLEDHAALCPWPGDFLAVQHHPSLGRSRQPAHDMQKSGLAAAGRTDDTDQLADTDGQ